MAEEVGVTETIEILVVKQILQEIGVSESFIPEILKKLTAAGLTAETVTELDTDTLRDAGVPPLQARKALGMVKERVAGSSPLDASLNTVLSTGILSRRKEAAATLTATVGTDRWLVLENKKPSKILTRRFLADLVSYKSDAFSHSYEGHPVVTVDRLFREDVTRRFADPITGSLLTESLYNNRTFVSWEGVSLEDRTVVSWAKTNTEVDLSSPDKLVGALKKKEYPSWWAAAKAGLDAEEEEGRAGYLARQYFCEAPKESGQATILVEAEGGKKTGKT